MKALAFLFTLLVSISDGLHAKGKPQDGGVPVYTIRQDSQTLIADSRPGLVLKDQLALTRNSKVYTTLAKYSPLYMAADLPQNYEGNPAFRFIEDVPGDWEYTLIRDTKIGAYGTTACKDLVPGEHY